MGSKAELRIYKKSLAYSYVPGAFAVFELMSARPDAALYVYARTTFAEDEKLRTVCDRHSIPYIIDDYSFVRTGQKENCYVFAVFNKYNCILNKDAPHLCLVEPSDMGNLGSILRSMAAFGFSELAIIGNGADIFDPKTIRASMGAIFKINIQHFDTFEEYSELYPGRVCFPFMTDGGTTLEKGIDISKDTKYTLIFGNEAAGLPQVFKNHGQSIRISQTGHVDSLNLSVAVGIGLHWFFDFRAQNAKTL